jgi:hypothetical protein
MITKELSENPATAISDGRGRCRRLGSMGHKQEKKWGM